MLPLLRPAPFRALQTLRRGHAYHFDTHQFVRRLEEEGLKRAQAEGILKAMAEVIDESVRNMTRNMVTKAEQEKVCETVALLVEYCTHDGPLASLYATSGLRTDQIRAAAHGEE